MCRVFCVYSQCASNCYVPRSPKFLGVGADCCICPTTSGLKLMKHAAGVCVCVGVHRALCAGRARRKAKGPSQGSMCREGWEEGRRAIPGLHVQGGLGGRQKGHPRACIQCLGDVFRWNTFLKGREHLFGGHSALMEGKGP